jgi:MFS family permease
VLGNLYDGLLFALRFTPIRAILLLLAVISFFASFHRVLLPVFAKDILHGGPATYGFMAAAIGIGAVAGSFYLAMRPSIRGMGRIMAVGCGLIGASTIGLGLSQSLPLSYGLLAVAGFGMMAQFAGSNSLLQTLTDDDKRGRVMSLYVMAFMGMFPLGGLLAGWLAARLGAPTTVIIGGSVCLLAAGLFATRLPMLGRLAHPVYVERGIVADPGEIARL